MNPSRVVAALAAVVLSSAAFGQFTSSKVGLLSQIPLTSMPGSPSSGAGCTGYVSPGGREYAIMGVRTGTIFVDITTPALPQLLSLVVGSTTLWHENTVMGDYAYLVSDQTGTGVQIVDLHNVDTARTTPLAATYADNGLTTVHTIQANPVTKTLYLNGSNRGLVFLDATNPVAPVEVGRWQTKYVHDCVPVNYTSGPYAGKEIVFACCGGSGLYILDVTNKASVVVLGNLQYLSSGGYCHSGLLSQDKRYFMINDEFDESNGLAVGATTHVIDVQNLATPTEVTQFHNPISVIDHNSTYQDGYMMLAAYRGGVRIYDPTNPLALSEVGYFDTYPGADAYSYDGAWGTFAGFPSGNIIISDINRGLFVVDPSEAKAMGAPIISAGTVLSRASSTQAVKKMRKQDGILHAVDPIDLDIVFQTTAPTRQTVKMTLTALKTLNVTASLQLKNVNTGVYQEVMAPALTGTLQTFSTIFLSGSSYIDAQGKIYARFKTSGATNRVPGVSIDMLRADVN